MRSLASYFCSRRLFSSVFAFGNSRRSAVVQTLRLGGMVVQCQALLHCGTRAVLGCHSIHGLAHNPITLSIYKSDTDHLSIKSYVSTKRTTSEALVWSVEALFYGRGSHRERPLRHGPVEWAPGRAFLLGKDPGAPAPIILNCGHNTRTQTSTNSKCKRSDQASHSLPRYPLPLGYKYQASPLFSLFFSSSFNSPPLHIMSSPHYIIHPPWVFHHMTPFLFT